MAGDHLQGLALQQLRFVEAMLNADVASAPGNSELLSSAVRDLIGLAPKELAIDLVAVAELATVDLDLARERWVSVRSQLQARGPRGA